MQHIGDRLRKLISSSRITERGELMKYFVQHLNSTRMQDGYSRITMSRMGRELEKIPTKDLYYLKRVCDDAPNFSKRFWWELDPEKHQQQHQQKHQAKSTSRYN